MAFPIKYEVGGNEANCIKKGNLWLGFGGRDYGPTSSTNFYGITPPSENGYTIAIHKSSGGPAVYNPSNDSELIEIVNGVRSQSFTSVDEVLNYVSENDDIIVIDRGADQIVTDGLVLNVDASSLLSYPTTGSVWYDLSRNNNTGSLENDPSFNNGGWFDFDGTDVKIKFDNPPELNFTSSMSHEVWFWRNSNATTNLRLTSKGAGGTGESQQGFGFFGSDTSLAWSVNVDGTRTNTSYPISVGEWYQVIGTTNLDTGDQKIYLNGEEKNSTTLGGSSTMESNIDFYVGSYFSPSNPLNWDGKIGPVRAYSKALSPTEIKQNYYGGPIVTDGLVWAVDASNLVSYESGSTTVYPLTGSITGSLENSTEYNSNKGGVWDFDGTDSYITFPANSENIISEVTCEAWFKPMGTPTNGYHVLFQKNGGISGGAIYGLRAFPGGSFWGMVGWGPNSGEVLSITGRPSGYDPLTIGRWYYVAITYDSNYHLKLYVDGIYVGVNTNGTAPLYNNSDIIRIGTGDGRYTNGEITNCRIYDRPLSSEEIWQNYTAQRNKFTQLT